MEFICTSLYIGILLIAGYATVSAIIGGSRRHFAEIVGLAGMAGTFTVGTLLFWTSLAGMPPRGRVLAAILLASMLALAMLASKRKLITPSPFGKNLRPADCYMIVPGLLLAWTLTVVSIDAFGFRLCEWDAYAIWGLKAKMFWFEPLSRLAPTLHDANLGYSHLNYPPLIPFAMSGIYAAMGHVNDAMVRAIFPFLLISFASFLYGSFRAHLNRTVSLSFAAIAVSLPGVVRWAGTGVADVPLMIFYGASLVYLVRWVEAKRESDLLLAVLFTVAMWSSKMEGFALGAINLAALVLFGFFKARSQARVASLCKAALLLAALLAPLLYWNHTLPRNADVDLAQINVQTLISNFSRIPAICSAMCLSLTRMELWSGLWFLTAVAALFGYSRRPDRGLVLITFLTLSHFGTLFAAYFLTTLNLQAHLATSLNRVLLHLVPCAILLCAHVAATRHQRRGRSAALAVS